MFIYSVRATTVKFFAFIAMSLILIVVLVAIGGGGTVTVSGEAGEIDYSGIKTSDDRIAFIKNFGIEIDESSVKEEAFVMPDNFDRVILGYNELQKRQGLDLSKYAKKKVTRYTYTVTNYDDDGEVLVNLFVYRGKIIACDLSSADPEGFVMPLALVNRKDLK